MIPYPLRVGIVAGLYDMSLIPGRFAAWYINRLADKLIEQEKRVVWAMANLHAWPNRVEQGAPGPAVEAFWIASSATTYLDQSVTSHGQSGGITVHTINR